MTPAEKERDAVVAQARQDERRQIVRWLRGETESAYTDPMYEIGINLSYAIERGDHLTGRP